MVTRDDLHRTVKLELEEGSASTIADAERLSRKYVLQVAVGADVADSPTWQATLLTAVNVGVRAFPGGVRLVGSLSWNMTHGWGLGQSAEDVIHDYKGAQIVSALEPQHPTIIVGRQLQCKIMGSIVVLPTWEGWSGGVVTTDLERLPEDSEFALIGVFAGALAVSECFGHVRGEIKCGHRRVGLSLWEPATQWCSEDACGPPLRYLPTNLWVLGAGHVGQACIWALGFLPYHSPAKVELWIQDYDRVVPANVATGLLIADQMVGMLKTRVAAKAVESLGMKSRLVERRFDDRTIVQSTEPRWAIVGFDSAAARRSLQISKNQFEVIVDIGLGTSTDYRGFYIHLFPSAGSPRERFAGRIAGRYHTPSQWAIEASEDQCGAVSLDNVSVGAAFVGAVAASVSIAELLKTLMGCPLNARLAWSLQSPESPIDIWSGDRHLPRNPGYQDLA